MPDSEPDDSERIERLERIVAQQQAHLKKLMPGRRDVLKTGAGAMAGAAGVYAATGGAAGQSGAAGNQGTEDEPNNMWAWDLNVANQLTSDLDAGGNSVTNLAGVETEEATIDSVETGPVQSGIVTLENGDGLNGASEDGWDTIDFTDVSVSFDEAFSETPNITLSYDDGESDGPSDVIPTVRNSSTSGFEVRFYQYGTTNHDDNDNNIVANWIAQA